MRLFQLATALLFSTSTVVSAWQCLSDANAAKIVNDTVALLLHATPEQTDYARAAAYETLSPHVQQYGDSINALRGDPVSTTPSVKNASKKCNSSHGLSAVIIVIMVASPELLTNLPTQTARYSNLRQLHYLHRRRPQCARSHSNQCSPHHPRLLSNRIPLGVPRRRRPHQCWPGPRLQLAHC